MYATNGNLPDAPSDLLAITFVDPCRTETFSVVPNPPANLLSEVAANPVTGNFVVFSVNNFSGCGGYAYSF